MQDRTKQRLITALTDVLPAMTYDAKTHVLKLAGVSGQHSGSCNTLKSFLGNQRPTFSLNENGLTFAYSLDSIISLVDKAGIEVPQQIPAELIAEARERNKYTALDHYINRMDGYILPSARADVEKFLGRAYNDDKTRGQKLEALDGRERKFLVELITRQYKKYGKWEPEIREQLNRFVDATAEQRYDFMIAAKEAFYSAVYR